MRIKCAARSAQRLQRLFWAIIRAMSPLQSLRQSRTLIRWMLVWFALAIGVAVAAPVLNPQAMALVCSAGGTVKLVVADEGSGGASAAMVHTLDCVMCLPVGAPPASGDIFASPASLTDVMRAVPLRHVTWRIADPASARGPPTRI